MNNIMEVLSETFGLREFRNGQREAIAAVLGGDDALVVMPTGSGKSLCYQLSALRLPGTTLVVSPLIALMQDQVEALTRKGVAATCLHGLLSKDELEKRMRKVVAGECKLVYVAPERLRTESFALVLEKLDLSMIAIDEAHCISQWGHDFRPDYLEIGKIVARFPQARILALTATATPAVREDIIRQLQLGIGKRRLPFVEVLGFSRPNLQIGVTHCRGDADKTDRLLALVKTQKTGIVYVSTRKNAERVFDLLCKELRDDEEIQVLLYHAGMTEGQRSMALREFQTCTHPVVVATTAFGMGIDRADIRFVAHWNVPGGIEQYYQEIGRAGRDGKRSFCELFYNYVDVKVQEYFIAGANPTTETALLVWGSLLAQKEEVFPVDPNGLARALEIKNGIAVATTLNVLVNSGLLIREQIGLETEYRIAAGALREDVARVFNARREKYYQDRRRLRKMLDFVYAETCRHRFILDYFGDQARERKCGGCDNCDAAARRARDSRRSSGSRGSSISSSSRGPSRANAWGFQ